jgi:hypothetical protein
LSGEVDEFYGDDMVGFERCSRSFVLKYKPGVANKVLPCFYVISQWLTREKKF